MDAAMEQTIGLCHRCGKLGCAPTSCPLNQRHGRSRTRDPVAALKERFNIGHKPPQQRTPRNNSHSRFRSRSKSRDRSASAQRSNSDSNRPKNKNQNNYTNPSSSGPAGSSSTAHGRAPSTNRKGKDRSVSFSSNARIPVPDPNSSSTLEAALNILNVLKSLQHDVARVESRILNLELNNQRLSVIEACLGIDPPPTPVANSDTDRMEEDPPETGTLIPHPSAPLVPGSKMSSPPKSTPIKASHPVSTSNFNPSPQDELNSVINDQKAIKDTLQSLTGSIQGFIASLKGSPSDRADSAPSQ
ncbi:hypothetical protein RhiirC2_797589 [Rhizophagus irregularis]|uniref:Uncharacterized protein n=1 Tax=Rhizophagus irregularis TaxID=588596 RepID=A0A2N1M7T7_9GLOM|nr:hypothetical protein RhiirC2_797589 [Rhizophagus irregularis]